MTEQAQNGMERPLEINLAVADYDRVKPLAEEAISPEGIKLNIIYSAPSETFYRMLHSEEFDASEMSLSTFLIARSQGKQWTGIPVFPNRSYFHTSIYCNKSSNIREPKDLEGKRFGLPEYQVTAAVWLRAALQHDFDVDLTKIHWFVERSKELSHGGETGFKPPTGIEISQIPSDETMISLLERGEIDAIMPSPYSDMQSRLNKTNEFNLQISPKIKRLFDRPFEEGKRYFAKNGFAHINHTLICKNSILKDNPWVAMSLYRAFEEAKRITYSKIMYLQRSSLVFAGAYLEQERKTFGDDPYPYGFRKNRKALEALVSYSVEQGLTSKKIDPQELFAKDTLST
jgi:4,5-dihydroxyphthalate decarboxylase